MQVVGGLVYMQGQVNHSPPINVVLDSGASLSIVSPALAKAIGLKSTHSAEAASVGTGSSSTLHVLDDAELAWGNPESPMRLAHQPAAIYPIEYVSAQLGKRTDALFGSSLFLHYTITVDYEHERVTFAPPGKEPSTAGNPLPISIQSNTPFIEASVVGEDGERVTGLFLIDSGTSGAMLLNHSFVEAHPGLIAKSHFAESPAVTAVGGIIRSSRVRVPLMEIGPFQLSGVIAAVPEASTRMLANPRIAGFIGAGILKRFTVTWDYTNKSVSLLPNASLKEPFETDASGLHLTSTGPEYQAVLLDSVLAHSPAARAGLMAGDEILAVNDVAGLPVWKVAEALRKAGTSVLLKVKRQTQTLTVTLVLRSPFIRVD
jgi:hypothetical protein